MASARLLSGPTALAFAVAAGAAAGAESPARPIRLLDSTLVFLAVGICVLVLWAFIARLQREVTERRQERFGAKWEPVFYGRMAGDVGPLPTLARTERLMFLRLWLHVLGYVRDDAAEAVVQAARDLRLPAYVMRMLRSRSEWKRVIAIQAAGTLRLRDASETLTANIAQNRPRSSVAAVHALLLIDPQQGLVGLEQVLRHLDWPLAPTLEAVKAGGLPAMQNLSTLVLSALPGRARLIVRLIELLDGRSALPALRERLGFSNDPEEIAAIVHALGRLGSAEDRPRVLELASHAHWLVRMQSAFALGVLGDNQDCMRLLELARDSNWAVRFRAAQAMLQLMGAPALGRMREREHDAFAREMFERVLAEGG